MQIREARSSDVATIARLRLEFLAEHRGIEVAALAEGFEAATDAFLRRHADTSRSWLADHDGATVGVVTMLLLDLAPRPEDASGVEGFIINLYVAPTHRRRGTGRHLLDACLGAARAMGLRRMGLYATDQGRPLYADAGFHTNPNWLELLP